MKLFRYLLAFIVFLVIAIPLALYIALSQYGSDELKPLLAEKVRERTGRALTIDGDISVTPSFTPTLTVSDVSLSNPEWASDEPMASIESLDVSLDLWPLLKRELVITNITANNATLRLIRKGERANWQFQAMGKPEAGKPETNEGVAQETDAQPSDSPSFSMNIEMLTLSNSSVIAILDGKRHEFAMPGFEARLAPRLSADGALIYQGAKLTLSASSKASRIDQLTAHPLAVSVADEMPDLDMRLQTVLRELDTRPQGQGTLALSTDSLHHLNSVNPALNLPESPPLNIEANLSGNREALTMKLGTASYGDTDIDGTITMRSQADKPYIIAKLRSPSFTLPDADNEQEQADTANTGASGTPPTQAGRGDAQDALPLEALGQVNGRFDLRLDQLRRGGQALASDITLNGELQNGVLNLAEYRAAIAGGQVQGNATIDSAASPARHRLSLQVNDVSAAKLAALSMDEPPVENGPIQATLSLSTQGDRIDTMRRNLSGSLDYVLGATAFTVPDTARDTSRFLNSLRGKQTDGSRIKLACGVGKWRIRQGLAASESVLFDTREAMLDVSGNVNLVQNQLSLILKSYPKHEGLSDLPIPVRLSGSFGDIRVAPDPKATVQTLSRIGLGLLDKGRQRSLADVLDLPGSKADLPEGCFSDLPESGAASPVSTKEGLKQMEDEVKEDFKDVEDKVRGVRDKFKGIKNLFD